MKIYNIKITFSLQISDSPLIFVDRQCGHNILKYISCNLLKIKNAKTRPKNIADSIETYVPWRSVADMWKIFFFSVLGCACVVPWDTSCGSGVSRKSWISCSGASSLSWTGESVMGRSLHNWERKAEKMEDLRGKGKTNICLSKPTITVADPGMGVHWLI